MKQSKRGRQIAFLFLFLLGIFWIIPIVWLIFNSFKYDSDFITSFANLKGRWDYLTRMIPRQWTGSNYTELFVGGENVNTTANIMKMFQNSFVVSGVVTVFTVFITSLAAFAYERLNFKGGNKIFWTLMYVSMFPNVVAILPQFRIANALGWVNNLNALIWPALSGVFNIFMIRNFMKSIPKALDEAATIDGATSFQVYTRIILPSIAPVMIVVGLVRLQRLLERLPLAPRRHDGRQQPDADRRSPPADGSIRAALGAYDRLVSGFDGSAVPAVPVRTEILPSGHFRSGRCQRLIASSPLTGGGIFCILYISLR